MTLLVAFKYRNYQFIVSSHNMDTGNWYQYLGISFQVKMYCFFPWKYFRSNGYSSFQQHLILRRAERLPELLSVFVLEQSAHQLYLCVAPTSGPVLYSERKCSTTWRRSCCLELFCKMLLLTSPLCSTNGWLHGNDYFVCRSSISTGLCHFG